MRKLAAHYIFDGYQILKDCILVVSNEGEILSIEPFIPTKELAGVEFINGLLCPGFVNAHSHLELSILKGKISPHGGMEHFIQQMKSINRSAVNKKKEAIKLADREMFDEGIVACGDIVNTDLTVSVKQQSSIYYHNFIELYSIDELLSEMVFQKGLQLFHLFENNPKSITYHAPYSVSFTLHQKISDFNRWSNSIFSIHSFEAHHEVQLFKQWQSGEWVNEKNPMLSFLKLIPQNNRILFVHNTFIDEFSFNELLRHFNNRAWVLCPTSNLFIENSLPPLTILLQDKKNLCIGTDSYASNYSLSIIQELKVLSKHFPYVELIDWLRMATIQGAKALEIQNTFGALKIGTKPGIIALMDLDLHHLTLTNETYVKRLM